MYKTDTGLVGRNGMHLGGSLGSTAKSADSAVRKAWESWLFSDASLGKKCALPYKGASIATPIWPKEVQTARQRLSLVRSHLIGLQVVEMLFTTRATRVGQGDKTASVLVVDMKTPNIR